jgi:hypothetical protein
MRAWFFFRQVRGLLARALGVYGSPSPFKAATAQAAPVRSIASFANGDRGSGDRSSDRSGSRGRSPPSASRSPPSASRSPPSAGSVSWSDAWQEVAAAAAEQVSLHRGARAEWRAPGRSRSALGSAGAFSVSVAGGGLSGRRDTSQSRSPPRAAMSGGGGRRRSPLQASTAAAAATAATVAAAAAAAAAAPSLPQPLFDDAAHGLLPVEASAPTPESGGLRVHPRGGRSGSASRRGSAFAAWGNDAAEEVEDMKGDFDEEKGVEEKGEKTDGGRGGFIAKIPESFASVSTVHVSPRKGRTP